MKFEPKYYPLIKRIWLQVSRAIIILAIVIIPIDLMRNVHSLPAIIFGFIPTSIILLGRSFFVHRYYLKSIEINEHGKNVILDIVYFNNPSTQEKIELENLDAKITQALFSLRPYYKLQIFYNKELFFQQREFEEWNKETFEKIVNCIKDLKAKTKSNIK